MIETLPDVPIDGHVGSGIGHANHPMRVMTRRLAGLEEGDWDERARSLVTVLFDELAPEWHTRSSPQRTAVVTDALERGVAPLMRRHALALEAGSGIGTYSGLLADAFDRVLSVEMSWQMLSRAGSETLRVQADAGQLPVADDQLDGVILINAFLFPDEVKRVLRVGGVVLWVNSSGEQTPIHLTTDEVVGSLRFGVEGVQARAGVGTWCALRRVA